MDQWGLPQLTEHTIVDREDFFDELEEVSEQGHAFNQEETHEGLHAVGAPIHTSSGEVLGAFSLSGPRNRLKGDWFEHESLDLLKGKINELELNLSYLL